MDASPAPTSPAPDPPPVPLDAEATLGQRIVAWAPAIIALGILARFVRYLGCWPLWGDETALAVNLAERDFAGLLRPLDVNQIAPVGYLFTVKALTLGLGFNEYALRLVSLVASLLVLWVVYAIARAELKGWEAWLSVAVLAVAHFQIRHSAELKQYALETLVTAVLVLLALAAMRGNGRAAGGLLLLTPLSLLFSMPAAFVGGGIALATLPVVWRSGSRRWWAWYVTYGATLLVSFGLIFKFLLSRQIAAQGEHMDEAWAEAFPDLTSVTGFLGWVLETATGVLFAIPVGGEHGASIATTIVFAVGVHAMWRDCRRDFLRLLFATMLVALVAAFLRKYPFGGHSRLVQYLVPLQCIPIGAGLAELLRGWQAWCLAAKEEAVRERVVWIPWVAIGLLVAAGLGNVLRDVARPYHGTSAREKRDFARWFWQDYRRVGTLRCASEAFRAEIAGASEPSRHYGCFRALYASDVERVGHAVPASIEDRVGLVVATEFPDVDREPFAEWERRLSERYRLVSHVRFPVNSKVPFPRAEEFHVFWIEPRADDDSPPIPDIAGTPGEAPR